MRQTANQWPATQNPLRKTVKSAILRCSDLLGALPVSTIIHGPSGSS
jgi:hypothetical protein